MSFRHKQDKENMITEDYVSFETAKLLKEKGFDEACHAFYDSGHRNILKFVQNGLWNNTGVVANNGICVAPTLQMARKWLRREYGLFIRITEDMTGNVYEWSVYQKNYGCRVSTYVEDSYEQAEETAIKYCLENLI